MESEAGKAAVQGGARRLGRIPESPTGRREAPADFDARRKGGFEGRDRQTGEANELGLAWDFQCPESKAPLSKVLANPGGRRVALLACEQARKMFHDSR